MIYKCCLCTKQRSTLRYTSTTTTASDGLRIYQSPNRFISHLRIWYWIARYGPSLALIRFIGPSFISQRAVMRESRLAEADKPSLNRLSGLSPRSICQTVVLINWPIVAEWNFKFNLHSMFRETNEETSPTLQQKCWFVYKFKKYYSINSIKSDYISHASNGMQGPDEMRDCHTRGTASLTQKKGKNPWLEQIK